MRRPTGLALLAAALLLTGCGDLVALHPLFLASDQVFDSAYEGSWETARERVEVVRQADGYQVTLAPRQRLQEAQVFKVHFVDLGGERFADVLWREGVGHLILRAHLVDNELHLAFLDSEWVRQQVANQVVDLTGGRRQAVLSQPTLELRQLVGHLAFEPRAYDGDELVLRRAS